MAKKCTHCRTQNADMTQTIPFVVSECEATRQHSTIKRLISAVMLLTILLFGSNLAWIIYNGHFETVTETYEIDLEQETERGNNNCIVNGGEICNGASESEN